MSQKPCPVHGNGGIDDTPNVFFGPGGPVVIAPECTCDKPAEITITSTTPLHIDIQNQPDPDCKSIGIVIVDNTYN